MHRTSGSHAASIPGFACALLLAGAFLPAPLLAGAPAAPRVVSYVESSGGLEEPEWDGGYTEVEMGDVNGDGHVDLVSIGDHGSPEIGTDAHGVMVWFGDGAGGWDLFQFGDFGYGGIALGDANGDGLMDVGYGMHHNYSPTDLGDELLEVALGDGTGRFWTAWDDGLATDGETYGMFGSDFADVDGDGDLDIGSISFGCCAGVHVYLNQGDGTWVPTFGFTGGNSRQEFVFGEVNGDGWVDFAVSHDAGTVYLGDGLGGFTLGDANLPTPRWRKGVALGDVNRDGRDDLAWIGGSGGPEVWSMGTDGQWSELTGNLPATGPWEAAQLRDMDGDGLTDLAAFGNGDFTLWKGDGAGGWTEIASFTTPGPGYYAAFRVGGDADHNGLPDIAIVAEEGGGFSGRNHLRFFKEASSPAGLSIRLVAPARSAALRTGSARFIEWASAVPGGAPSSVRLLYSVDGGPWTLIASGLANNGRHQWTVPDVSGRQLRLRAQVTSGASRTSTLGGPYRLLPGH